MGLENAPVLWATVKFVLFPKAWSSIALQQWEQKKNPQLHVGGIDGTVVAYSKVSGAFVADTSVSSPSSPGCMFNPGGT